MTLVDAGFLIFQKEYLLVGKFSQHDKKVITPAKAVVSTGFAIQFTFVGYFRLTYLLIFTHGADF